MNARSFMGALFGEVPKGMNLFTWTAEGKRTGWHDSIKSAASAVRSHGGKRDVYFGVSLQDKAGALAEAARLAKAKGKAVPVEEHVRGFLPTATAIGGVWIDIDVAEGAHKKTALPPTIDDALTVLDSLPRKPSLVLSTGGGLHPYWLFGELWIFESDEDRERARSLVAGWQAFIREQYATRGWTDLDATHDLTRVLRLPGTKNFKYKPPRKVEIIVESDSTWSPSQLEEWAAEVVLPAANRVEYSIGDVRARADANAPREKLKTMLDMNARFRETWERKRDDLASQSEYDLSLASTCAKFHGMWSDQDVVDLLVEHRRNAGLPMKHASYYERTIGKARAGMDPESAFARLQDVADEECEHGKAGGPSAQPGARKRNLSDVSALLGFEITNVIKFAGDPPTYRLVMPEGEIDLGTVRVILNPNTFREAVAALSERVIKRMKGPQWDPIAQAILASVEERDLGSDSSQAGILKEWIADYLAQHKPMTDRQEAIDAGAPFTHEGRVYAILRRLREWLEFEHREKLSRRDLAKMLRGAGHEPRTFRHEVRGVATTAYTWDLGRASIEPDSAERLVNAEAGKGGES